RHGIARTEDRELLPAVAVALELGLPFRAPRIELLIESSLVDEVLGRAAGEARPRAREPLPLLVALGRVRDRTTGVTRDTAGALLGWAVPYPDLEAFTTAVSMARRRLDELRRDDAPLTLATAHSTKGLEFDHVVVVGMEAGRFPSRRTLAEADDPARALEEERRLAYVAWTRARRSLTLLYDPLAPSSFLLEAFTPGELGLSDQVAAFPS
ncbi:MAG: ATP-dependent helicase, partial [Chloroflexi bacterium]|nr:ATP-dependent helicase [Chloroflexota bacterium]